MLVCECGLGRACVGRMLILWCMRMCMRTRATWDVEVGGVAPMQSNVHMQLACAYATRMCICNSHVHMHMAYGIPDAYAMARWLSYAVGHVHVDEYEEEGTYDL